jgi:hypothetical protein
MIKVYQIRLTDAEVDAINRDESFPKAKAFFDREFDRLFKAENFQYYTHVANVHTNDMEDAFRAMNLWEQPEQVDRLGPCSSMSVGDILELEDGSRHRVASFGFTAL